MYFSLWSSILQFHVVRWLLKARRSQAFIYTWHYYDVHARARVVRGHRCLRANFYPSSCMILKMLTSLKLSTNDFCSKSRKVAAMYALQLRCAVAIEHVLFIV